MNIFVNKRLKGAISIFLVIITIPTMLFSAVLIDGSRMASARAMAQEATDLAAASALASYHQKLKDQFGLFALDEKNIDQLKTVYLNSLQSTLLAYGMSADDSYSEQLWEMMKTALTGQKSYMGESFLNLYDFQVDAENCTVEPLHSLANPSVLENQMVEYAKFRGLYVMLDRMEIFNQLGNLKEEAQKNEAAVDVMNDKMSVDEINASADLALKTLRAEVDALNAAVQAVNQAKTNYIYSLSAKMEQIRIEHIDTEEILSVSQKKTADAYEQRQKELKNAADAECRQAKAVLHQAEAAKKEIENAIKRLEEFKAQNQSKAAGNEAIAKLLNDADTNIQTYKTEYLKDVQKLLDDEPLNHIGGNTHIASDIDELLKKIHHCITKYMEVIDKLRESAAAEAETEETIDAETGEDIADEDETGTEAIQITEYYYQYLNRSEMTTSAYAALHGNGYQGYQPAIENDLAEYLNGKWNSQNLNPSQKNKAEYPNEINEESARQQSGKTGNAETHLEGEAPKGRVEKRVYDARPSKTWNPDEGKEVNTNFYNKENDLSVSKNILNQGKRNMILDVGEMVRDDVLCFTYIFGTFKTRLTGVKKFSSEGISQSDKNSFYMPEWRYAHPQGELDMRFEPKKDRKTVLRSEIEYLVYGKQSDTENETAVYATIFAERMANNMIALYLEDEIRTACHAAAAAASALTLEIVPEPVFFWIFLTAWVTMETVIEMDYLLSGGYKIPLLKNTGNILTKPSRMPARIENYGQSGVFVTYEDYLLLLLLIEGREKRIMRSADLIEMNMKLNGDEKFTMAHAFTYIHADTTLSVRYLFGNVMPFKESYEANGYTNRMYFTNTIYQGY